MKKLMAMLMLFTMLTGCTSKNKADDVNNNTNAPDTVGEAVEDGLDTTGDVIGEGIDDVGDALTGDKTPGNNTRTNENNITDGAEAEVPSATERTDADNAAR